MEGLVVNGCSYAAGYAAGNGHVDLAKNLHIKTASSIALSGSSNLRILRTTVKHAHFNAVPTLYVIGLTFMSRWEIPIAEDRPNMDFEGRWINPQAQFNEKRQLWWTDEDTKKFTELNFKAVVWAKHDQFEDLIYRCLCVKDFLHSRSHKVVFFNQCGIDTSESALDSKFDFVKNHKEFVERLTWTAVPWQHAQGVPAVEYDNTVKSTDLPVMELRHRKPGEHRLFNDFLTRYIDEHKILS